MPSSAAEDAALAYAARGWSVVPIAAGTKRPQTKWEPYQSARPTANEIRRWFAKWRDAGVAIVTGQVSGLIALDVDPRHGGAKSLADLERRYGPLPESPEVETGGGGRHIYLQHPGPPPIRNRVGLAPGLDIRGDAGLIIAPPSIHPSGQAYRWRPGHGPADLAPAAVPAWLLALLEASAAHPGHPVSHWRALVTQGVGEGERNATIASLAGHLFWHGVDLEVVRQLLLAWNATRCQPPLDPDEVSRTVDSIRRTHDRQRGGPD